MAARLNPAWDQRTRDKIQATMLINRLQDFVQAKVEMSPAQVTAALGLLKKAVPDLQSVALTGGDGGPVQLQTIERVIVRPKD